MSAGLPSVEVALAIHADLGEGLHWDARRACLWLVDVHGRRLIRWDLGAPRWQEWKTPGRIGWAIPEAGADTLLLGLQAGIARVSLGAVEIERLDWLARPFEGHADLRLNDAKADASGAIWAGSMNNEEPSGREGCLFRLGPDGDLTVHDSHYGVANGPAISPDGTTMLHTDSACRRIYAFDLDAPAGVVSGKRLWKEFSGDEGYPDGMCFDARGDIWVAHWAAGCISCFAPDGALRRRIELPAPLITNVCFGGPALDRLFVTSARTGLRPEALARFPLSGSLFEVRVDTVGLAGLPYAASRIGD